jgi:soluble lytic murein transglycosylase-like protein
MRNSIIPYLVFSRLATARRNNSRLVVFLSVLKLPWVVCIAWLLAAVLLLPLSVQSAQAKAVRLAHGKGAEHHRVQKTQRLTQHLHKTYRIRPTKARTIVQETIRQGARHKLKPELILAVIIAESDARERAVSRRGARGLMQIIPRWHGKKIRQIGGPQALFKPDKNIAVGTAILAEHLKHHRGNLRKALLRYSGNRANPRSRYPDKVLKVYRKLQMAARTG